MSSRMRRGTGSKLSQNTAIIAAIMRLSAVGPSTSSGGPVLQPADGRLRAQISPAFRGTPERHLEGGIGFERVAVVAVGITRYDQQHSVADHLGKPVPHPVWRSWVLDAGGQPIRDLEPLLDRRQQQDPSVRSHPATVEGDLNRLACDRWQTRQNPRTLLHGGCELRWLRLIRLQQPSHTRNQGLVPAPPPPPNGLMNYSG